MRKTILGHVVSFNKIRMDPRKVQIIKDWKEPTTVKQLQSFLGLGGYYRRHIRDFSKIAQPLFNLLKKENSFIFDENCKRAFNQLKTALTTDPVLRPPDFNREFNLYTDSSFYSLGAILSQKDDEGREYVVAYASRLLKESEKKYAISEKEFNNFEEMSPLSKF